MMRRAAVPLLFVGIVCAVAVHAQESVKLELKYPPGQLFRHKFVANMTMNMQFDMPSLQQQMPSGMLSNIPMQVVGVMRQRGKKLLPNGDAEVNIAIESMRVNAFGQVQDMPTDKIPFMTVVIGKNGALKGISGLQDILPKTKFPGMEFMNFSQFAQGFPQGFPVASSFPDNEVKVGDVWTQELPLPFGNFGNGKVSVTSQVLSIDSKVGRYSVATLRQDVSGDIQMEMTMPIPQLSQENATAGNANMKVDGVITGAGTLCFSPEEGQVVRQDGKFDMKMNMSVVGLPQGGGGGTITMAMRGDYEMFLLPD